MLTKWYRLHPGARSDCAGFLTGMLDDDDPRSAREQFNANYAHGGGWSPMGGFKLERHDRKLGVGWTLHYPGDPPLHAMASTVLRDETIVMFEYAFVAVAWDDGSFEVARMD